jgi:hypothetical protein
MEFLNKKMFWLQDKEHLDLKRLKADNLDKDGLREAEIR